METKSIDTLTAAPYNPRQLSKHDGFTLEQSIKRWGDISGVTKNVTTGFLVTGHQRINILTKAFGKDRVSIEVTAQEADDKGTVGVGYVVVKDTNIKLAYREVAWNETEEKLANIAANRIQGDFDTDLLAKLNYDISLLDGGADMLALTGQTQDEIDSLLNGVAPSDFDDQPEDTRQRMNFKMTDAQSITVDQAINEVTSRFAMGRADNDDTRGNAIVYICEQYINNLNDNPEIADQPDQA